MVYYIDGDEGIEIEGMTCPTCSGDATRYDPVGGYWKCEDCSTVWGNNLDELEENKSSYSRCPYCEQESAFYSNFFGAMRCNVCASTWAASP